MLTVSRVQDGTLGLRDVALSMPTVISAGGAVEILAPDMAPEERERLEQSAGVLQKAYGQLRAT